MAKITFKDRRPNSDQLQAFGFKSTGHDYTYQVPIVAGQFQLSITVTPDGTVETHVIDRSTHDEYVLHLAGHASGSFTGRVASEYQAVLTAVETQCFDRDAFKAGQAQALIEAVTATYGDQLEFLWAKFPHNAVWRRADTHKWYGALLTVSKQKLGFDEDEQVTVLDLRAAPADVLQLVDHHQYFPGYHMNKRNWFTIILDGSVNLATIQRLMATSYQLAK